MAPLSSRSSLPEDSPFKFGKENDSLHNFHSISRDEKDYSVQVNALTKAYPLVPLSAQSTWALDSPFKIRKEKDRLHNFHSISRDE